MEPLLLTTILSCQQVIGIASRLQKIALLSSQQKMEIVELLRASVPSCPVIIKSYDTKAKSGD
jgi:hypothetical protein